ARRGRGGPAPPKAHRAAVLLVRRPRGSRAAEAEGGPSPRLRGRVDRVDASGQRARSSARAVVGASSRRLRGARLPGARADDLSGAMPPAFEHGVALFNAGQFFEAHGAIAEL